MKLTDGIPGVKYEIISISGQFRNRLAELGFNPGCEIKISSKHFANYIVVNCRGSQTGLTKTETENIHIAEILN